MHHSVITILSKSDYYYLMLFLVVNIMITQNVSHNIMDNLIIYV